VGGTAETSENPHTTFNGYVRTNQYAYPEKGIALSTAVAISGAALSPNQGYLLQFKAICFKILALLGSAAISTRLVIGQPGYAVMVAAVNEGPAFPASTRKNRSVGEANVPTWPSSPYRDLCESCRFPVFLRRRADPSPSDSGSQLHRPVGHPTQTRLPIFEL